MIEKLIDFAIRSRMLIIVLTVLVMAAGYWSYTRLPVDAFPDVSPNLVQVFTVTEESPRSRPSKISMCVALVRPTCTCLGSYPFMVCTKITVSPSTTCNAVRGTTTAAACS